MAQMVCLDEEPACQCLLSDIMEVLGRTYAMDLLCVVANHRRARFGEIEDHIPDASTSTLSARLDELEAAGLLEREQYDETPPRVEYALTAEGAELAERLEPLIEWLAERE